MNRDELAIRTKINARHLAALEEGDFAALPARIYAVGFARSYAGAVGLDAQGIAAQVRRELDAKDAPVNPRGAFDLDLDDPAKVPTRRIAWLAAALAVAVVVAGAVFWRSYFVPAVDLPPVREDVIASTIDTPELSPTAMISPTAESAAGLTGAGDPAAMGAEPAPALGTAAQGPAAASRATPAPRASAASAATAPQPAPAAPRSEPVPPPAAAAGTVAEPSAAPPAG